VPVPSKLDCTTCGCLSIKTCHAAGIVLNRQKGEPAFLVVDGGDIITLDLKGTNVSVRMFMAGFLLTAFSLKPSSSIGKFL